MTKKVHDDEHNRKQLVLVIGLGYVGLNLACSLRLEGVNVHGFDVSSFVVDKVNACEISADIVNPDTLELAVKNGFQATTEELIIGEASEILICVPTPLNSLGRPDTSYIETAAKTISKHIKPGQLIVLESTSYPGTTENLLIPILEESGLKEGEHFSVAFSSERVDPGNKLHTLKNTPKIVAAPRESDISRAVELYSRIADQVVTTSRIREAEFSKLLENSYRLINITFINELARLSASMGFNLKEVIRLASTKPFGFHAFFPGPGVGGHCIPVDPVYLSDFLESKSKVLSSSIDANIENTRFMSRNILSVLESRQLSIEDCVIVLVGMSYKSNSTDIRESASVKLGQILEETNFSVLSFDPLVNSNEFPFNRINHLDRTEMPPGRKIVSVVLQKHECIDASQVYSFSDLILDSTHSLEGEKVYLI